MSAALPIDPLLPEIAATLADAGRLVLQAPPGAGKTTRVPLALMDAVPGRIVMLEPRRLAARAAAERMAASLGEMVGATVGYRIRGEAKVSGRTRIEVVTEGILTRMLQADPELPGVGAVIFDEFHERSLNADLGLALVLEARETLRPDLALIVMSATLDAAPVAALLDDAPVLTAEGRAFPVETRWLDRPVAPPTTNAVPLPRAMAELILTALDGTEGGVLAFLPGEGEIRRVAATLAGRLPRGVVVQPLYGAMDFKAQRAALSPLEGARKLVLATAIAETSLTIPDVRVVVDAGLARRARHDPARGMSRLVTEPVSRAEAEQRRGRAGRVAPGLCFRLWTKGAEGALPAQPPAEIETADLTGLALELAAWGSDALRFLTPPPEGPLAQARALLADLGALDDAGRITRHGRAMAALPLHPRLAHMLLIAGKGAAPLAALTTDRDPLTGAPADMALRLDALDGKRGPHAPRPEVLARLRAEAARLARLAPAGTGLSPAQAAALAFPDRIARRRAGEAPRYLLSGGRGAVLPAEDPLAGADWLVVIDLDGGGTDSRIRLALPITEAGIREVLAGRITAEDTCEWSPRDGRILSRRRERLGALVLSDVPWSAPLEARARAALEGLRALGLGQCGMTPAARRLQARVELLREQGAELPAFDDASLAAGDWALPFLMKIRSADDLRGLDLTEALRQHLGWEGVQELDRLAPPDFVTPLGRKVPIDYASGAPEITVRLQEMFGVTQHPAIGPRRLPLKVTLTSPAQRPIQTTTDLPGFWAGSYAEVRKEMRGRYPRHPWPEDPTQADPTLRARPRGG